MSELKPIETKWNGYLFRSRLEARWAVFFDALGLRWEYEPEGFDLGEFGYYLPDFYLPDLDGGIWVEVKPDFSKVWQQEYPKWSKLVKLSKHGMLLAAGTPASTSYWEISTVHEPRYFWQKEEVELVDVCFNSKYLPPYLHDGKPRLFWMPGDIEIEADCYSAIEAARSARFEYGQTPQETFK